MPLLGLHTAWGKGSYQALGAFLVLLLVGNLHAASFDCGKAVSEVEKIICGDDELSRFDESLNKAYLEALKRTDIKQHTIGRQRQWLKSERNACRNAECIKKAYETRIKELGLSSDGTVIPKPPDGNRSPYKARPESETIETQKEENDYTRSLTMTCDYCDSGRYQRESVTITKTKNEQGEPAGIKEFSRGKNRKEQEHETFIVNSGEFAECIYPSGTRVRVKVGEGSESAFGECGGDAEVFMSLWVNERKIVSREQFAGRCWEIFQRDRPDVSFKISRFDKSVSVEKCHTVRQGASDLTLENDKAKKKAPEPLSVCVDFPDVSKYHRDPVEYPSKGAKTPKVGDIELLNGSHPVCQAALPKLEKDFYFFTSDYYPDQSETKLSHPNWSQASVELLGELGELADCNESIFDFNNDGKLDRVFRRRYISAYMHGSVLLVQPGRSSSKLMVSAYPTDSNSIYLPFQMGKVRHNIHDCPPFSQDNDEAGFSMKGRNEKDELYFRGRYSSIEPFSFQGTTYIAVNSYRKHTKDFVAVLKPMPDGTFQKIGLFRQVSENF